MRLSVRSGLSVEFVSGGIAGNELVNDGRGKCGIPAHEEVGETLVLGAGDGEVEDETRFGIRSPGKGKNRRIPSGRVSGVKDLPYDLGVRINDWLWGCHV
jgi:hypothetical protein